MSCADAKLKSLAVLMLAEHLVSGLYLVRLLSHFIRAESS